MWERGWRQGWGAAGGSTCSTRRSTGTARRPGSLARAASATGEDACCKFVKVNNEFGQARPFSKTPTSSEMIVERSTIAKKKLTCRWASRCQFSEQLFRETGAGGRCLQCRGNRDGAKCEVGFPKPSLPHFPERFAWLGTIRDQEMGRPSLDRACFAIAIPREVSATSVMIRESAHASQEWLGQGLQRNILLLHPTEI